MLRLATKALAVVTLASFVGASLSLQPASAGTTGGLTGRVVDSQSNAPIAGVTLTATAATQTATSVTDASGSFRFLSLAPDTYTIQLKKSGYDDTSQPGITIFADQVQTLTFSLVKSLKTIARVASTSAGNLVKSGTGSDVYSVNSTVAGAAAGLTGAGSLTNAYGAIASVPGVQLDAGQQGWFQTVHIRGGDIDQVGYELDGIPVNRVYDNAPMTMLSSLGQQELQVYTGGTPASADAQGISGYVNQVVKTGTYPGYGTANLAVGSPAFYHNASIEAGGSTPDRRFSYYVGIGGSNQDFRYIDNSNGAGQFDSFFYPVNNVDPNSFAPGPNGYVYVGNNVGAGNTGNNPQNLFASGIAYGISGTAQRDALMNFHFALPHKRSGLRDDIQLLYLNSEVFTSYYSSQKDLGPVTSSAVWPNYGGYTWDDSYIYSGALGAAPNPSAVIPYYFPGAGPHPFQGPLPASERDSNDNGVAVEKLQYQHAFSDAAFLRIYGYMLYSNWFIYGPNTAAQPYYGAELAQYTIPDHTYGANISFTDQLSDHHLLTASYGYTGSNLERYDIGYIRTHYSIASYQNGGNCYDPTTGTQVGCIWFEQNSTDAATGHNYGDIQTVLNNGLQAPSAACLANPACAAASWTITNNHFYSGGGAALNQVHTRFSGLSIGDQWRPDDRWNINLGVRVENFRYIYGPTGANDPVRQFWFNAYNNEYCSTGIGTAPVSRANSNGVLGACPTGTTLLAGSPNALTNPGSVPDYVVARWEPRFSFTYTLNPDTVIRGSAGVYARPPNSSWVQYNVAQEDLPYYLGNHFAAYGFTTPEHTIRPDTSYNYDLSWEQRIKGTDMSFKITPFYRATRDQLQNFFIDPAGGLESGLNVGNQVSSGVELAFTKGDFSRDGFAGQLSYTYTHSRIKYQNFPGQNVNVVDQLNNYIKQYNGYTANGGGSPFYCNGGVNATGTANPGVSSAAACAALPTPGTAITNPYYCATVSSSCPWQTAGLLDRNAWYTTYDVIPGPFAGLNGYAVPHVISLLLNYKRQKFDATMGVNYNSGASYGAPTTVPGYDPATCSATLGGTSADPASCGGLIFTPNPYNGYQFDTLGQYKQPWTLTLGMNFSYEFSPRIKGQLNFANLINTCGQRGYAWDNSNICTYGALGASLMASAGNFYPNSFAASPPPQMRYPYGFFVNNTNTGFVGTRQPIEVTGSLQIKL